MAYFLRFFGFVTRWSTKPYAQRGNASFVQLNPPLVLKGESFSLI